MFIKSFGFGEPILDDGCTGTRIQKGAGGFGDVVKFITGVGIDDDANELDCRMNLLEVEVYLFVETNFIT